MALPHWTQHNAQSVHTAPGGAVEIERQWYLLTQSVASLACAERLLCQRSPITVVSFACAACALRGSAQRSWCVARCGLISTSPRITGCQRRRISHAASLTRCSTHRHGRDYLRPAWLAAVSLTIKQLTTGRVLIGPCPSGWSVLWPLASGWIRPLLTDTEPLKQKWTVTSRYWVGQGRVGWCECVGVIWVLGVLVKAWDIVL